MDDWRELLVNALIGVAYVAVTAVLLTALGELVLTDGSALADSKSVSSGDVLSALMAPPLEMVGPCRRHSGSGHLQRTFGLNSKADWCKARWPNGFPQARHVQLIDEVVHNQWLTLDQGGHD